MHIFLGKGMGFFGNESSSLAGDSAQSELLVSTLEGKESFV